ncbi:mitogen-activated protein kinase kinase kinase 7 isoform X3 [Strongylocentrotus purpuratus]|uniref:Mitogen-activated protein kinase kinase kinase 7 n=1 Tax=Strongylocentrotus purpuratus TaxID=7668 RepID=A0A7M7PFS3_STRPU|nr:mitogen-activated protein kinase kinase kinase 7 isoform X3 [Strongylocentrotus purpuratus]
MARLVTQMSFKEEVEFNDIDFEKVVGKGAFGVVSKASWRGMNVAVKMIESEEEIKAFRVEVMQLSRVDHPNIVKLYGACTTQPVCLVMEFAEGGSLYNVLHSSQPQPIYKAAHAMSWALQCAKGVDYLHSMKPKKLIHRDLKPANLLLMSGGTVLKICDFGTACDFQTYMTNNKGSAAWMAPEVFEGRTYSEKCDIFSWGVILWEVISRRKPFDDIGGPAFRIMWAVHNGRRPPLIRNIPKPLDKLMTRCWSQESTMRPSMHEVVSIMSNLMLVFKGADQPLVYPQVSEEEEGAGRGMADRLAEQTADMSISSNSGSTISDTVIHSSSSHSNGPQDPQKIEPHAAFSDSSPVHSSAKDQQKRHSVDLLDLRVDNDNSANDDSDVSMAYSTLEPHLQPLPPNPNSRESQDIFDEHMRMAQEFLRVQTELALLHTRKKELAEALDQDWKDKQASFKLIEEYNTLQGEKESLVELHKRRRSQLDMFRLQMQRQQFRRM